MADEGNEPKPLPMKAIGLATLGLFVLLVMGFLVVPAFFDTNPMGGRLFEDGPAPWALSEEEQSRFEFTESQTKGRYHFQQYCASCHGPEGRGNGPSSATLTTRPPNLITTDTGAVKNGLGKAGVLKTLEEGIAGSTMGSYAHLPAATKAELADYVEFINTHPALF